MRLMLSTKTVLFLAAFLALKSWAIAGDEAYVGTETCLGCHADYDRELGETRHVILFKGDLSKPGAAGCESCHGAGGAHMEDPAENPLRRFLTADDPDKKSAACLSCHARGDVRFFSVSTHAEEGLACSDCHAIHGKSDKQLKKPQTKLCAGCHEEKAAEIQSPGRHPVTEGKTTCASCHSPHQSLEIQYESGGALTQACVGCHQEKEGPFLYEHEPAAESCLACHKTHGSAAQNLLQFKQPSLCLQCHSDAYQFHNVNLTVTRECSTCHEALHGSNLNADLLR